MKNKDKYSIFYWEMITKDALFSSIYGVEQYLTETDFNCIRDLYSKLKLTFSDDPEKKF